MAYDYIPRREAELVTFAGTLLRTLEPDPSAFGLDAGVLATYRERFERFVEAYGRASNPETRVKSNITRKDECKRDLIATLRQAIDIMQAWPGMSDVKRDELGIPVRGERRRRVSAPTDRPLVFVSASGRTVDIAIGKTGTRSKPADVVGAILFVHYGDAPPTGDEAWRFLQLTRRTRLTTRLEGVRDACTAWVTAAWFNGRMELGPRADPTPINLAKASAPSIALRVAA
jgi:hypothetical protein